MLRDFCQTFREDEALGISWPISPAMYQVCRKFLAAHPAERGRLWEVEPPGAWGQRGNIWLKIQLQQSRLHPDSHSGHSKEAVATRGQTSQDDGPRLSHNGEDHKERISGDQEQTNGDHAVKAAAGWLARACQAGQEGPTAADAGLPVGGGGGGGMRPRP